MRSSSTIVEVNGRCYQCSSSSRLEVAGMASYRCLSVGRVGCWAAAYWSLQGRLYDRHGVLRAEYSGCNGYWPAGGLSVSARSPGDLCSSVTV